MNGVQLHFGINVFQRVRTLYLNCRISYFGGQAASGLIRATGGGREGLVRFFFSPHAVSLIKPSLRVSLLSLAKEEEAPPAKKVEKTKDPNLFPSPLLLGCLVAGYGIHPTVQ